MEHGPSPDPRRSSRSWNRAIVLLVLAQLACTVCSRGGDKAADVTIHLNAVSAVVDRETVVEFVLADSVGKPFEGASLTVQAHMTHPGMAPVIERAVDAGKGTYKVSLRFTMAGVWVLYAKGTLADRRVIDRSVGEVTVRPAN